MTFQQILVGIYFANFFSAGI